MIIRFCRSTAGLVGNVFFTNGGTIAGGLSMSEQDEGDKEEEEGINTRKLHVVDVERVAQDGKD